MATTRMPTVTFWLGVVSLASLHSASACTGRLSVFSRDTSNLTIRARPCHLPHDHWFSGEVAHGSYNRTYESLGWDLLSVYTNPDADDAEAAYAAGFLEGHATANRIEQAAVNAGVDIFNMSRGLSEFLAANGRYTEAMEKLGPSLPQGSADRRIWYHSRLVQRQLDGLHAGYLHGRMQMSEGARVTVDALTAQQLLLLNIGGDLEDLDGVGTCNMTGSAEFRLRGTVTAAAAGGAATEGETPKFDVGRCSALIRLTADNGDLLVAQETWASLNSMLRIYKMYDLPFKNSGSVGEGMVAARRVSFSSYPGTLNSGDDFYVLSSGLIQQETTIGNSNRALAERFISPLSMLEWRRNIVANRLAVDCKDWSEYYRQFNSGTYNNQNMCVDFNKFTPGQPLENGTFVITEQIPGYVIDTDVSERLQTDRYFGSYNTAYDPTIRKLSGADDNELKFGDWFSYDRTARAQIFKRDAPGVESLDDMKRLMRSCDYKHDPLSTQLETCKHVGWSNCTPSYTAENCIATRGDLNSASGVWGLDAFGHRNHVATDAKIAQYSTFSKEAVPADIVCGPTGSVDNPRSTPDFIWSESDFESTVKHVGHVDKFTFDWLRISFDT